MFRLNKHIYVKFYLKSLCTYTMQAQDEREIMVLWYILKAYD